MDNEVTDGVSSFLNSLRVDFPAVVDAMSSVPDMGNLHRVRDSLASVDREKLEFLAAFSLTFLAQAWNLTALTLERRQETQTLREKTATLRHKIWASMKLARDPKQAAKAEAFKQWRDWQAGRSRFKSGAAFARHVVETLPKLESTKVVERWVTQWRNDAQAKNRH